MTIDLVELACEGSTTEMVAYREMEIYVVGAGKVWRTAIMAPKWKNDHFDGFLWFGRTEIYPSKRRAISAARKKVAEFKKMENK